ncbi:MAG: hypothetical protein K1X74_12500 [Pirellulales bacterium]|nr:hypothetical protein [Pirellulales bacterium]
MIAPLKQDDGRRLAELQRWRRARRIAGEALLRGETRRPTPFEPVPAWQAWLLAGWVAMTAAVYLWIMLVR